MAKNAIPVLNTPTRPTRRRRIMMRRPIVLPQLLALALLMSAVLIPPHTVGAVEILFRNACGKKMVLSDGKTSETIQKGSFVKHTLATNTSRAYRYSKSNQATLAEFTVDATNTWYDIGIIPAGDKRGPEHCTSLEDCKNFTGGVGFNVAMKIIPGLGEQEEDAFIGDHCRTLDCFADGCEDAYHFPADNTKTHNCPSQIHFTVVFCATAATGSSDSSLGWDDAQDVGNSSLNIFTVPSPEPTLPPKSAVDGTATTGSGSDSGTTVAVFIASIVGGAIVALVVLVLVRKYRYKRLENVNNDYRSSSEAMIFVEAHDVI